MKRKIIILFIINSIICEQKVQDINTICHKIKNKFKSSYSTINEFFIKNNYNFDYEKKFSKSKEIFDKLIGQKLDEDNELEYFNIVKKSFLNTYIIIFFILWLIFIITFLKKKYILHFFSISIQLKILIILCFFIFIISCILAFSYEELDSFMNDANCNLLKFFYELNHGKIKESSNLTGEVTHWPGFYSINSILIDTIEEIDLITSKYNETFYDLKKIKEFNEIIQAIFNNITNITSKGIKGPNKNNEQIIYPLFFYEFNKTMNADSIIYDLFLSFLKNFVNPSIQLELVYNYTNNLSSKEELYENSLEELFENFSKYSLFTKDKTSNLTDNIIIFQEKSELISIFMKFINKCTICLCIIITIFSLKFYHKIIFCVKILLHIFWNLIFVLVLIYICFYNYINNIDETFKHSIYLIETVIIRSNENNFFIRNKDLDLLYDIEKYYRHVLNLIEYLNKIFHELVKKKNDNKAINIINRYINNYEFSTDSSFLTNDIHFVIEKLTNITNNLQINKNGSSCKCKDIWVTSKNNCRDYLHINKFEINEKVNRKKDEKYCFVLQEDYQKKDLEKLYSHICSNKDYLQIINYISGLNEYYHNIIHILEYIKINLNDLDENFSFLSDIMKSQIKRCKKDFRDLLDVCGPIFKQSDLKNIFRPEKLEKRLINYYDLSYNKISHSCKYIKIYIVLNILLEIIYSIFIINNINKHIKGTKRRKNNQSRDLDKNEVELIEEVPGEDEDN